MQTTNTDKAKQSELKELYIAEYARLFPRESAKHLDWLRGEICRIVELDGGELLKIAKPKIKTDFCFGYGYCGVSTPEDYESAESTRSHAATNADYFIRKNLEQLSETVDLIREYLDGERGGYCGTVPLAPYVCNHYNTPSKIKALVWRNRWDAESLNAERQAKLRNPTADELQRILAAYETEIKAFEKRLQTYLKRYGLAKLHTWTYLSD